MENTTFKILGLAAVAAAILYITRKSELFTGYDESEPSRFERNAPAADAPAAGSKLVAAAAAANGPKATSANMLPKPDADDGFGQFAPNPKELTGQNFVDATRWVSLGAMMSRRNVNRDIRGDVPIPKTNAISPWNQSSIDQQQAGKLINC